MSPGGLREILVVAGDASADRYGAGVIERLAQAGGLATFGVGGARMQAAGLEKIGDARAISVVGISEAARGLLAARRLLKSLVQEAKRRRPAVALLMDLPDFNLPLARRLKKLGVPVVYYVAPQAWAWRRGRVRKLRRRVERLCVILPFEEEFFRRRGVAAEYVGHPLTEQPLPAADPRPQRVLLLPGSRRREVERLAGPMLGAARLLKKNHPELRFILPLAEGVEPSWLGRHLAEAGETVEIDRRGAAACLPGARLALAASGTVTLEAALAGVPLVVTYRLSRLSYLIVRSLVRVDRVCLVNLLLGRSVVPELLQGKARPHLLAAAAERLLADGPERQAVLQAYRELASLLGGRRPAERVAEVIGELAGKT